MCVYVHCALCSLDQALAFLIKHLNWPTWLLIISKWLAEVDATNAKRRVRIMAKMLKQIMRSMLLLPLSQSKCSIGSKTCHGVQSHLVKCNTKLWMPTMTKFSYLEYQVSEDWIARSVSNRAKISNRGDNTCNINRDLKRMLGAPWVPEPEWIRAPMKLNKQGNANMQQDLLECLSPWWHLKRCSHMCGAITKQCSNKCTWVCVCACIQHDCMYACMC